MSRRVSSRSVISVLTACLALLISVAGFTDAVSQRAPAAQPSPTATSSPRAPTPVPAQPILEPLDPTTGEDAAADGSPVPAAVQAAVGSRLDLGELGGRVSATVVDAASDELLFARARTRPVAPASSVKVLTTIAALELLGPQHRVSTRVLAAAPEAGNEEPAEPTSTPGGTAQPDPDTPPPLTRISLVGGGDPRLTSDPDPDDASQTSIVDLAESTAQALQEQGRTRVRLTVDATLFGGPAIDPDWESGYVPGGVAGPVSALSLDGGRVHRDQDRRAEAPHVSAGERFAELLENRGITVAGEVEAEPTPQGFAELAAIESAPMSAIVEHVNEVSDNDAAEILLRLVALGAGRPGTSDEGANAVLDVLESFGIDTSGTRLLDGSGLARGTRVPTEVLARVVAVAAEDERPGLRPLLTSLPVAGATGTLQDRFRTDAALSGRGEVRAKTGTLSGVTSLTGTVMTADGDLLAFSAVADRITSPLEARSAMDEFTASLAACGCR